MLELRKKDGNIIAIGYNWLERVEFDPSDGITLHLGGQKLRIKGRNLMTRFNRMSGYSKRSSGTRLPGIQETDEPFASHAGRTATVVEAIVL